MPELAAQDALPQVISSLDKYSARYMGYDAPKGHQFRSSYMTGRVSSVGNFSRLPSKLSLDLVSQPACSTSSRKARLHSSKSQQLVSVVSLRSDESAWPASWDRSPHVVAEEKAVRTDHIKSSQYLKIHPSESSERKSRTQLIRRNTTI